MKTDNLISPNGLFMAHLTADAKLKTWNTSNINKCLEFTMDSHLSAPCTLMYWKPLSQTNITDQIIIGTEDGKLFLYDMNLGEFIKEFPHVHEGKVNDAIWDLASNNIFSCASDRYIIQWEGFSITTVTKWIAHKGSVTALCMVGKDKLLSASTNIKLWDYSTQTLLKKFSGHTFYTAKLCPIPNTSYFLSFSDQENTVSCWNIDADNKKKALVSSFIAHDDVKDISVQVTKQTNKLMVAVLTKQGYIHRFFKLISTLQGQQFEPENTVTIEIKEGQSSSVSSILGIHCHSAAKFLIASGNSIKPVFEAQLFAKDAPSEIKIFKQTEKRGRLVEDDAYDRPFKRQRLDVIPQLMAPAMKNKPLTQSLLLEDGKSKDAFSSAATRITMGVQNGDFNLYKEFFKMTKEDNQKNEKVVESIIKALSKRAVMPFLKILVQKLEQNIESKRVYEKWIYWLIMVNGLLIKMECKKDEELMAQLVEQKKKYYQTLPILKNSRELNQSDVNKRPELDIYGGFILLDESKNESTISVINAAEVFQQD